MNLHRLSRGTAVAVSLLIVGCQSMSTESHASPRTSDASTSRATVHFNSHSFGAYCYDTVECDVIYAGTHQLVQKRGEQFPAFDASKDPQRWSGSHVGIANFPGPAELRWRTGDGAQLSATVDIPAIFKDRVALHHVPTSEIPPNAHIGDPDIIVVVQGRKVSVYMKTFVPTIHQQTPGNQHSSYRNDPVLAWSHTY